MATLLATAVVASAALGLQGCSGEGLLRCGDGPCYRPGNDWTGGADGALPRRDLGGTPPADLGPAPADLGPSAPDEGRPPLPDLGPRPDLGDDPCPWAPWPRDLRVDRDPSGGGGGPLGVDELTLGSGAGLLVQVPDCQISGALYGLVIVLHDADGDREYLGAKWRHAARDRGYVVGLPQAVRTYEGDRNWLANQEDNRAAILEAVELLQGRYPVDRTDTVLTGLGVGATFANELAVADEDGVFEHLLLVNGSLWDPTLERRVRTFIVLGTADASHLARREPSDHFRYLYVAELGAAYPGPVVPARVGDRSVPEVSPTSAVDWFWP